MNPYVNKLLQQRARNVNPKKSTEVLETEEEWSILESTDLESRFQEHHFFKIFSINPIPIVLSESRLLDGLQRSETAPVSKRTIKLVHNAVQSIQSKAQPRGIFRVFPLHHKKLKTTFIDDMTFNSKNIKTMFQNCSKFVVFLTTLGKDVDKLIRKTMDRKPHYGYIMNVVASAAAEEATHYLQRHINKKLSKKETTTYRYSPGYCDWHLKEQAKLYNMIPYRQVGVKLSDDFLMTPSKSVSGIFGVCAKDSKMEQRNLCIQCPKQNCSHRRK